MNYTHYVHTMHPLPIIDRGLPNVRRWRGNASVIEQQMTGAVRGINLVCQRVNRIRIGYINNLARDFARAGKCPFRGANPDTSGAAFVAILANAREPKPEDSVLRALRRDGVQGVFIGQSRFRNSAALSTA